MLELKQRTKGEMKAYIEGFTNAYKQFREFLTICDSDMQAINSMETLVKAVQSTVNIFKDEEGE